MKFICDRSALQEGLSAASSVTLTRTPKPILQCVRLTAETEGLTLTTYDQEVGLRFHVQQVEVTVPGETLVPCDKLMAIVRESSDETMAFETSEDTLHVRGKDSHFQILSNDVREFPPVPDMEGEANLVVKIGPLREAVEQTLFAAARESTRYAINGILWQMHDKQLRLVATDGRRLAMSNASLEKSIGDDIQAIVPTKTLGLLGKFHSDTEETMDVRVTSNQIIMRSERVTISSVLVEGNFPKWEDVVPRDNDKELSVETSRFLSAARRAALLANVESKGISMSLEGDVMELQSRSAEQGEAQVRLEVKYNGPNLRIGFNPEFLIDALKVCDDNTTLLLKDPGKPGLLRSGKNFQYVVMPVNLS
ncbi:MAG: DNA polymerase III subunit beta [Phycisphaerae bacterium]